MGRRRIDPFLSQSDVSLMIRSTQLMTAVLGLSSVWGDLNPDLNTVDEAEARDDVITAPDYGYGHGHAHAHDNADSLAVESDPTAAGYYNYDFAYAQNYYKNYQDPNYQLGYRYSDYSDDELVEKQGGGPTPADFIPFIASFSLPLTAALITFVSIIVVSAAFLLFPETIEIDVDSRKKRSVEDSFLTPGMCGGSSSKICRVLEKILLSIDCYEVARCEVAQLSQSPEYPTMASMLQPFVTRDMAARYKSMDCAAIKCSKKMKTSWINLTKY